MPIVFGRGVVEKIKEVIKYIVTVKTLTLSIYTYLGWTSKPKRPSKKVVAFITAFVVPMLRLTYSHVRRVTDLFVKPLLPAKPLLFLLTTLYVERGEAVMCPRSYTYDSYARYLPPHPYPQIIYQISTDVGTVVEEVVE